MEGFEISYSLIDMVDFLLVKQDILHLVIYMIVLHSHSPYAVLKTEHSFAYFFIKEKSINVVHNTIVKIKKLRWLLTKRRKGKKDINQ